MKAKSIGEIIIWNREKKGWKQVDVERKLGMSHTHYCNIENGMTGISFKTMEKLNSIFGIDLWVMAWAINQKGMEIAKAFIFARGEEKL